MVRQAFREPVQITDPPVHGDIFSFFQMLRFPVGIVDGAVGVNSRQVKEHNVMVNGLLAALCDFDKLTFPLHYIVPWF